MFYVVNDMTLEEIKKVIQSYHFGDVYGIHCIHQPDGARRILVHYNTFTNVLFKCMLDMAHGLPCVLYGRTYIWYIYKTLTMRQRTMIHFRPICNGSLKN